MSHSHTPGGPTHTHGPSQSPMTPSTPQSALLAADPKIQAVIDASYSAVPLVFNGSETHVVLCPEHKLEVCSACDVDFLQLNRISRILQLNTNLLCPPPPQMVSKNLSQTITKTKDEGNQCFKLDLHAQAVAKYTLAASIAVQRPPWEANQVTREEVSAVISNRSAAYLGLKDCISALADAENVIALRRNWPKGHFRKAKALVGLGKFSDAADALNLGLSYEPNNTELAQYLNEVLRLEARSQLLLEKAAGVKKEESGSDDEPPNSAE